MMYRGKTMDGRQVFCDRVARGEIREAKMPYASGSVALAILTDPQEADRLRESISAEFVTALKMYLESPPKTEEDRLREIRIMMTTVVRHRLLPRKAAGLLHALLKTHAEDPIHWEVMGQFSSFSRFPEVEFSETGVTTNAYGDYDQTIGLNMAGLVGPFSDPHFLRVITSLNQVGLTVGPDDDQG